MLRQDQGRDQASKAGQGQMTVRVTTDGGATWNSWTAENFPRFRENYPLAYYAHLAPLFRDFAARNLCAVPAAVARKALSEAKAAALRPSLSDLLNHDDANGAAVLWSREIEMLNRDAGFLIDCLECDDLDVRTAALKQFSEVTGKTVTFDVFGPPEKRKAAAGALRRTMNAASNGL
jgi:hypothetical protein